VAASTVFDGQNKVYNLIGPLAADGIHCFGNWCGQRAGQYFRVGRGIQYA
jgi:hypothetical protein